MKHFTLALVLLAVFASVALADRPNIKKKPVDPVPESVEEDLEDATPEKHNEEEEVKKLTPKRPIRPAVNKQPALVVEPLEDDLKNEEDLSEEVKEKVPAKKPLLGLKPQSLPADLDIQPPENPPKRDEPIELEPPTLGKPKVPRPALIKVKA